MTTENEPTDEPTRSRGLLYGRRKGKTLRDARARAYETGLRDLALDLSEPLSDPKTLFGAPTDRLALEIGFGGGEHLLHQLARQETTGFIGCEPFVNGMARLLDDAQDHPGRSRLRVHEGDAREVIERLPDQSLDQVYLLYPDPWPKLRHEKRRFMSVETLSLLHPRMKLGAELRLATDIDIYKKSAVKAALDHLGFDRTARDEAVPWPDWLRTRYEAKAVREGRTSAYFSFFAKLLPD
ncbi:MAG: tRNA (guanine(46)-N(7))-methyltransferase TrmB [Pseudomonadota bacterium]